VTATRVASVRFGPELGKVAANRRASVTAIERAASAGARLVVLPELASSGYSFADATEARASAEPVPGPTTRAWQEVATRLGVVIVGGVCELDEQSRLRNTVVVVDESGVRGRYRKLHLWGREQHLFLAGDERPPVVETPVGRIGLGICYDLWFPELSRDLAVRGAEILAFPSNLSATPAQDGLPHLDVIVAIATAHVNRVHLVLADRCGTERGHEWLGAAVVVGADGTLLAGPPAGTDEAIAIATIDPVDARSKQWDALNDLLGDRRPDVFRCTSAELEDAVAVPDLGDQHAGAQLLTRRALQRDLLERRPHDLADDG
jgi:predicted amidohydrolase